MQIVNFKNELEDIPKGLVLNNSNAFPSAVIYRNKLYLTFRSAVVHMPIIGSRIIVLSRDTNSVEKVEVDIRMNHDLREPRLVKLGNKLFLYFSSRQKPNLFDNDSIFMSEKLEKGWSAPIKVYKYGFTAYSVKNIGGTIFMACYNRRNNSECCFVKSKDGVTWSDVFTNKNVERLIPGETDFVSKNNFWYFVSRNEFGKFGTYGTEVFKFDKSGNLILHKHTDIKMDGPVVFEKDSKIYLIARRNLANGGKFILPLKIPILINYLISKVWYGLSSKKTSIWKLDEKDLSFSFETDLISGGDTSYACILRNGPSTKIFYYSSDPVKKDSWIQGQFGKTSIYSVELV